MSLFGKESKAQDLLSCQLRPLDTCRQGETCSTLEGLGCKLVFEPWPEVGPQLSFFCRCAALSVLLSFAFLGCCCCMCFEEISCACTAHEALVVACRCILSGKASSFHEAALPWPMTDMSQQHRWQQQKSQQYTNHSKTYVAASQRQTCVRASHMSQHVTCRSMSCRMHTCQTSHMLIIITHVAAVQMLQHDVWHSMTYVAVCHSS